MSSVDQIASADPAVSARFDVERIREDFPILHELVHGKPLVYLDNAATAHKPRSVIEATNAYYRHDNANIHRGVHELSQRATAAYERTRTAVAQFINASSPQEIVFVRGATEAINLVAQSYGTSHIAAGDEILLSHMEHHSNIVPWQLLAERVGARIRVIPMDDAGQLDLDAYRRLLGPRTKIVGLVHISNALGTINPVAEMIEMAHAEGAPVLIDGAQAAPHQPIDVQALDCDFYTISSHKMFGPDGVGVLYGKADLLETMPPYQGGGEMIRTVAFERTEYAPIPAKFEAGTPHISGVIALRAAIEYLEQLGWEGIRRHETDLLAYGTATLLEIPGLRLIGTAAHKASVLSFVLEGVHPHDIGTILDQEGIAIRTGHHCAQPVMERFGVPATARASLAFYNTRDEIDVLGRALHRVREIFG